MSSRQIRPFRAAVAALVVSCLASAAWAQTTITQAAYVDKLQGAWVAKMAACTYGASQEGASTTIISSSVVDSLDASWTPSMINNSFYQDDLCGQIPFIDTLKNHGPNATWTDYGNAWKNSAITIYAAGLQARTNLQNGIAAPSSGNYAYSPVSGNATWNWQSNFAGLVAPGQPQATTDIMWRASHVITYGDGSLIGVAEANMQSAAFTATSWHQVIDAGVNSVPSSSLVGQMMRDVVAWHDAGDTWTQTWNLVTSKYSTPALSHCDTMHNGFYDPKLNGAYVMMALMYSADATGTPDLHTAMRLAVQASQDTDCNAGQASSIIGAYIGLSNVPSQYKSGLATTGRVYDGTSYTYQNAIDTMTSAAQAVLLANGGSISGTGSSAVWTLPNKPAVQVINEQYQYPTTSNNVPPTLTASLVSNIGNTVTLTASATASTGIAGYQWFLGDLSIANGQTVTETYLNTGSYTATCYVTDGLGNTAWKQLSFTVGQAPPPPPIQTGPMSATYQIGTAAAPSLSATSVTSNVTATDIVSHGGLTIQAANSGIGSLPPSALKTYGVAGVTTPAAAVSAGTYLSFVVTPVGDGATINLANLSFDVAAGSNSLTRGWVVRSSADGFAADIASGVVNGNVYSEATGAMQHVTIDLSAGQFQGLSGITFEVFSYNSAGDSTKAVDFDNFTVNGTVVPEPMTLSLLAVGALALIRRRK